MRGSGSACGPTSPAPKGIAQHFFLTTIGRMLFNTNHLDERTGGMKTLSPLLLITARKLLIPLLSALGGAAALAFSSEYQAFCGGLF